VDIKGRVPGIKGLRLRFLIDGIVLKINKKGCWNWCFLGEGVLVGPKWLWGGGEVPVP